MSVLELSDDNIIQYSKECMKYGKEIPLDIQVWLDEKGLLYKIMNPIKESA